MQSVNDRSVETRGVLSAETLRLGTVNGDDMGKWYARTVCGVSIRPYLLETRNGVYPRSDLPGGYQVSRDRDGCVRVEHASASLSPNVSGDPEEISLRCAEFDDFPPLLLAARMQNVELMCTALENGAKIDAIYFGMNALHHAVENNNMEMLEVLARHPDFSLILNIRNSEGMPPMMQAAVDGHWSLVSRLLDLGADVELVDKNDCSVLIHVLDSLEGEGEGRMQSEPVVLALKLIRMGGGVNPATEFGPSALEAAVSSGYSVLIKELVERGVDVNHREGEHKETVLFHAVRLGLNEIGNFLLESGADPSIISNQLLSPFSLAAVLGRRELLVDMLESERMDIKFCLVGQRDRLFHLYDVLKYAALYPSADHRPLSCNEMSNLFQRFGIDVGRLGELPHRN